MSNFIMSPKYGANNSYHVCPWCGKRTGGYTSFGKLPDDEKAPDTIIASYNPCESCNKTWQKTVPVIEISAKQISPGQPPINSDEKNPVYPTLRVACITLDAAKGLKMDTAAIGVPYLLGENRFSELFDDVIEANLYPPTNPAWGDEKPLCSLSRGAKSVSPSLAGNNIVHQVIRVT